MSSLYEKFNHGDQRTIVQKFQAGKELYFEGATIVLKTHVALKVTQEYDAKFRVWKDLKYDLPSMVEITRDDYIDAHYKRPEPTSIPGDGVPRDIPRAEVVSSGGFWQWLTGWFKSDGSIGQ